METYKKQNWSGVSIISTEKIWYNIRHLWWICLIFFLGYGSLLGINIWRTYQSDLRAVKQDTWQASFQIYYPNEGESEAEAFMALGESNMVIGELNASLKESGYALFGEGVSDSIHMEWVGDAFGITVIAEGGERSQFIAQNFGNIMIESAEIVMGRHAELMGEATVVPCVVRTNGTIVIFGMVEEKNILFSLGDFVSWKKILILFAVILLGAAVIFVMILFDRKIRAREEAEEAFSLPCIAVIKRRKEDSMALFGAIAVALCHKQGIQKLMLTTLGKSDGFSELKKYVEREEDITVTVSQEALISARTVEACSKADGVILVIQLNQDRLDQTGQTITNLELVSSQLLGYILLD